MSESPQIPSIEEIMDRVTAFACAPSPAQGKQRHDEVRSLVERVFGRLSVAVRDAREARDQRNDAVRERDVARGLAELYRREAQRLGAVFPWEKEKKE